MSSTRLTTAVLQKRKRSQSRQTLEIAKSGAPLPPGTQIVLGIWQDYKLTGYFVMEKGEGWGLEVAEEMRTGDWHFQQFDTKAGQARRHRRAVPVLPPGCGRQRLHVHYRQNAGLSSVSPLFLFRLALDFLAVSLLLAAYAYNWLGNAAHEVIGTAMFALLISPQHLQSPLVRDYHEARAAKRAVQSQKLINFRFSSRCFLCWSPA